jgi:retron-type reverse transcriptase
VAYKSCLKGKSNSLSALEFEENLECNLLTMSRELRDKTYKTGPFSCFPITDPKLREVWAADFRDRIVHHLLVSQIEQGWEKIFIHDSYACRTEKGAHKAIEKIKRILSKMFYLHVDIRGFFTSIDKNILFEILSRRNKKPDILYLTRLIIFHDPKSNYVIKGNERILRDVPLHKSLFGVPEGKGLPIGNYTSQFFANVYMNELDQYAKRTLKCRYYFRYMDDVVILDPNKDNLRKMAGSINIFLNDKLKIELHPKKTILQDARKGLDFLGYVMRPEYTLSRKRVVGNIRKKLAQFNKQLKNAASGGGSFGNESGAPGNEGGIAKIGSITTEEILAISKNAQQVVNSYWGHFKHANCASLRKTLYEKHFGELKKYLEKSETGEHFVIKKGIFPEKK